MSLHAPTVVGALTLITWIYLVLARGWFWRMRLRTAGPLQRRVRIAAIIPARNEAEFVAKAVSSVQGQQSVDLHIYLVDDNSTDGTADIARNSASSDQLTIISGKPLPAGWTGK